ncbi:MAG TPA: methyltransferase domain-containing protein, partial [Candidatus Omnitrophota bacterium]|nr:methyltransferase domain-containing protein [Candidatus Omnitrophota bacterium]
MFAAVLRTVTICALLAAPAVAQEDRREVPYVPTPDEVVQSMLTLAGVGPDDYVVDLGSGDGRIVVAAARDFGAQGIGVDKNPVRIREANANAAEANVTDRVRFVEGDLFDADISKATVVTMYLLPEVNLAMRPRILGELKPGTRVVSHDFDMGDWRPDKRMKVPDEGSDVYLWVVPAH